MEKDTEKRMKEKIDKEFSRAVGDEEFDEAIKYIESKLGCKIPEYVGPRRETINGLLNFIKVADLNYNDILDDYADSIKKEMEIRKKVESGVDFEEAVKEVCDGNIL